MTEDIVEIAPVDSGVSRMNPQALQILTTPKDGSSMRQLRSDRESLIADLKATGQSRPATVINFNPVALRTLSPIPYSVPPCFHATPQQDMAIVQEFEGRQYQGSYLTVREPYVWPKIRGVKLDSASGDDVGDFTMAHLLPMGVVYDFYSHYNSPNEDIAAMGGVLILDGDKHQLSKSPDRIKIPVAKKLPNGSMTYLSVEAKLPDVLKKIFAVQRNYATLILRQARGFWSDEKQHMNITDAQHRVWGEFALKHGWISEPEEWMVESGRTDVQKCDDCGTPRKDAKAHFCAVCRAPYDAYASFMAGKVVPMQYLQALTGKKLDDVVKEHKRREAVFAKPGGESLDRGDAERCAQQSVGAAGRSG